MFSRTEICFKYLLKVSLHIISYNQSFSYLYFQANCKESIIMVDM